jgi:hypothetical protein
MSDDFGLVGREVRIDVKNAEIVRIEEDPRVISVSPPVDESGTPEDFARWLFSGGVSGAIGATGHFAGAAYTHVRIVRRDLRGRDESEVVVSVEDLRRILAGDFGGAGRNGRVEWAALEKDDVESSSRGDSPPAIGWSGGWD